MKVALIFCMVVLVSNAIIAAEIPWSYEGASGPNHWGEHFWICGKGRNQAPINIVESRTLDISEMVIEERATVVGKPIAFLNMSFDYKSVPIKVLNNGHTIQVDYQLASHMSVNGMTFRLLQFHFHSPSENRIENKAFAMEIHLVHEDEGGNLAVVAVMVREGASNAILELLWKNMPDRIGQSVSSDVELINVKDLLPRGAHYFYFNGSLTTPPCSEAVSWYVLKTPIEASTEQIDQFRNTIGFDNNRPVQPINARVVLSW